MDDFEKVKLKDQKLKMSSTVAKPEFKQHLLAPIRSLEASDQIFLLTRCKNKEISLGELKKEAIALRQLAILKKNFIKLTNAVDWIDAVSQFPVFACEVELKKFIALDFTKGIPQAFVDFCKRAKSSTDMPVNSTCGSTIDQTFVQHGGVVGYAFKENPSELTGCTIRNIYPSFGGADLIVVSIKSVSICHALEFSFYALYLQKCSTQDVENISDTAKEINIVVGLHTYTVVSICEPEIFVMIKEIWESLFTGVDVMFFADDQSSNRSGSLYTYLSDVSLLQIMYVLGMGQYVILLS